MIEKTITESKRNNKGHIKVKLKMASLLNFLVTAVFNSSFKNSNATHKVDNVQDSSRNDMAKVNRQLFWQQGDNFRMQVTPAWCRRVDLTDIVLGLGELVFQKLRLWLRENFLQFYFTAEPINFPTGTHVSHMGQASPFKHGGTWEMLK